MKLPSKLLLASASPRRKQLLSSHFKIQVLPSDILEKPLRGETPKRYVARMALEKWKAAPKRPMILLAADTIVVLGSKILGKPRNKTEATLMMKLLSDNTHHVFTSICVGWGTKASPHVRQMISTQVSFRAISKNELKSYLRTNDWKGKAGSYAIQGKAAEFVDQVRGSLTSVVGLPVKESLRAIAQAYAQRLQKS